MTLPYPAGRFIPCALSVMAVWFLCVPAAPLFAATPQYAWRPAGSIQVEDTLAERIPPPPGFVRVAVAPGSFAFWLRGLPLKPAGTPVRLFTGAPKWRQDVHAAVVDISVGESDLQQCADAIMRLRAEWLFSVGRARDIAFTYTGGKRVRYEGGAQDYRKFRRYMNRVFAYAGTYSLERELTPVALATIETGDVFIKGGFPGHAVLVADMAVDERTGEKRFLLLQSYMPAQDIHILKNPKSSSGSPWYSAAFEGPLETPEWTFPPGSLRRWPEDRRQSR